MSDVSNLASFPFVRMCQIDGLEGIENLAMICAKLRKITQKNDRETKNSRPPVSRGLTAPGNGVRITRTGSGEAESVPPLAKLRSYESWNHQFFMEVRQAKDLYHVQFW